MTFISDAAPKRVRRDGGILSAPLLGSVVTGVIGKMLSLFLFFLLQILLCKIKNKQKGKRKARI